MANLDISQLTNGVSVEGAKKYLDTINLGAIDDAKKHVKELDSVFAALRAGWQGSAETKFEKNLNLSAEVVCKELDEIKKYNEGLVADLLEDMAKHDESIIEEVEGFSVN